MLFLPFFVCKAGCHFDLSTPVIDGNYRDFSMVLGRPRKAEGSKTRKTTDSQGYETCSFFVFFRSFVLSYFRGKTSEKQLLNPIMMLQCQVILFSQIVFSVFPTPLRLGKKGESMEQDANSPLS
jgi:hypothetical protein